MRNEISFLTFLLSACMPAHASQWVPIDKVGGESYLLRQGDRDSLRRSGPWAEFTQQWLRYGNGVLVKETPASEVMAVNCLTGARSAKVYEYSDPDTDKRLMFSQSLAEIEQGSSPIGRINIITPEKGLDANMLQFACGCPQSGARTPSAEKTLLRIYDSFIKEQTKESGYHVHYLRFTTREKANAALKMMEAGASFASVARKLTSQADVEGRDLGTNPAHAWSGRTGQLLRTMKPGEYTRQPINGIHGYDILWMESRYEKPAAPFKDWRAAIEAYAKREQACGRQLF